MHRNRTILLLLSLLILLGSYHDSSAQNIQEEFGKNRVQYHDDFKYYWMYESHNFITYWYGKSRRIAESSIKLAEYDYAEIQRFLEHRINDKIEVIVYTDVTDLKQSNIGNEEVFLKEAGKTKIKDNKVFVAFDGSHENLRKQLRQGIATIYLNSMLTGSTLQEFVQNAIWSQLPDWYIEGLVSYVSQSWSEEFDDELRQVFWNEEFTDFFDFARKQPRLAGHSLWHYISVKYGNTALSNLLYLTRINRQLESGFIYVLSVPYEQLVQKSFEFYNELYDQQQILFDPPIEAEWRIHKKKRIPRVSQVSLSPDGRHFVYVTNELGRIKVYLRDIETKEIRLIFKRSFRNPFQETDYNYPIIDWGPNGSVIGLMYEKRDKIYFRELNIRTKEKREQEFAPEYDRVFDFSYSGNNRLVISASESGYSDLYLYETSRRTSERITSDFYDDLDVRVMTINGQKGIVFASNRTETRFKNETIDSILPLAQFDLFFYPLDRKEKQFDRLTSTPLYDERKPRMLEDGSVQYLSNINGIWNRWTSDVSLEGLVNNSPLTNRSTNIRDFTVGGNRAVETTHYQGRPQIYSASAKGLGTLGNVLPYTGFAKGKSLKSEENLILIKLKTEEVQYKFQSEFEDELEIHIPEVGNIQSAGMDVLELPTFGLEQGDPKKVVEFQSARAVAYRLHFKVDEINTTLNNDPLFGGLDSYAGYKKGYEFPPLGMLLKAKFKDVFEDYRFEVGIRVPTSFNGTEYFFIFDNNKYQWDKRFAFYRKASRERDDERFENFDETRTITHIAYFQLKYPFDIFNSLRFSLTLRQDKYVFLAEDLGTLNTPDDLQQRIGLKAEYVFDNTFDVQPNIKNGTRAKVSVEVVNRLQIQFSPWNFEGSEGLMTVVGFDLRHYERMLRHSVLALRFAGAKSFGTEKILYYMGGVDNWFSPDYNDNIPFPPDEDFSYQAAALQMRGFRQNIRNGSSFAVINAEARIPVVKYFTNRKIKSGFLRNLQVVSFFDVGTAWHGATPYSDDNPLNSVTLTNPVSTVTVKYFRDPLVYGYGTGLRVQVFGYPLRFDYAWGVDTREVLEPRFYFSMGMDF